MVRIGQSRLVFIKDIIGIFSVTDAPEVPITDCEYASDPPYKSYVLVQGKQDKAPRAYYTSLSLRSLRSRIERVSATQPGKECGDIYISREFDFDRRY